jgi:hypothetical protein
MMELCDLCSISPWHVARAGWVPLEVLIFQRQVTVGIAHTNSYLSVPQRSTRHGLLTFQMDHILGQLQNDLEFIWRSVAPGPMYTSQ